LDINANIALEKLKFMEFNMKFLALASVLAFSTFAAATETAPAKAPAKAKTAKMDHKAPADCAAVEAACATANTPAAECIAKLAKGEKMEGVTVTQAEAKACMPKASK
jgi:hypothetical protein